MKIVELVTTEEVKKFAYRALETSKKALMEGKIIPRTCYIFSSNDVVRETELPPFFELLQKGGDVEEDGTAVLLVDLNCTPDNYLNMACYLHPELHEKIAALVQFGQEVKLNDDLITKAVATALQQSGLSDGQVANEFMARMIELLKSYAYVHVSESWHVHRKMKPGQTREEAREELDGPPSEQPDREEGLSVYWETLDGGEHLTVPFQREGGKVDEGKVISFGEMFTASSKDLQGNLVHLLKPMPRS